MLLVRLFIALGSLLGSRIGIRSVAINSINASNNRFFFLYPSVAACIGTHCLMAATICQDSTSGPKDCRQGWNPDRGIQNHLLRPSARGLLQRWNQQKVKAKSWRGIHSADGGRNGPQSSKEDPDAERNNVLNLFYSQFGKPKIVEVCFECLDSCKGKQNSSL